MSEQQGHTNLFSAKDIQRYLKGELSPAEMHAIEKAALDDPFLADAIEGMEETMELHGEAVIATNLESIQQQIQNRVAKKDSNRVIAFRWWYPAAAAVVLLAMSIWFFNGPSKKEPNPVAAELATNYNAQPDSPWFYFGYEQNLPRPPFVPDDNNYSFDTSKIAFNITGLGSFDDLGFLKKIRIRPSTKNREEHDSVIRDSSSDIAYNYDANIAKQKADTTEYTSNALPSAAAKSEAKWKADTNTYLSNGAGSVFEKRNDKAGEILKKIPGVEVSKDGTVTAQGQDTVEMETIQLKARSKIVASANQDDKTKLHNVIKGRVVDQFSNPLSNANVISLDDRVSLTTDQYGLFKMPSNDSLVHVIVSVSGYTTQNFTLLNNAALNNIQLQPADVNIERRNIGSKEGYAENKSFSANYNATSIAHQDAQPAGGWVNFEQYLIKNKKTPPDNPNIKGQVVVSFTVNKKSVVSDIKIEQHLATGYDEEAIRLIKEGPQWKLQKGRKARIIVVVHF